MTPEQQYLVTQAERALDALAQAPTPPVCPASPEGAMPLQSATLPHKNFPLSETAALAATQRGVSDATAKFVAEYESGLARQGDALDVQMCRFSLLPERDRLRMLEQFDRECQESAKNLDLRPERMWQVQQGEQAVKWEINPAPKMESYEGIPAEVINEAHILGSDMPTQVLRKLEEQMKGKWVMVRFGQPVAIGVDVGRNGDGSCVVTRKGDKIMSIEQWPTAPEEMVNVRGEQRSVDEYCVATPVPCTIPTVQEALAMREMVEKAAVKLRGELHFDEGVKVVEETYNLSFLNAPRQHDSPLSSRVVPASDAPDPKVGW